MLKLNDLRLFPLMTVIWENELQSNKRHFLLGRSHGCCMIRGFTSKQFRSQASQMIHIRSRSDVIHLGNLNHEFLLVTGQFQAILTSSRQT